MQNNGDSATNNGYNSKLYFHYGVDGLIGFTYVKSTYLIYNYYYKKNAQGDIIGIYDSSGKEIVKYYYDAFGNVKAYYNSSANYYYEITETSSTTNAVIGRLNPFRYRGYYYDQETKLYYLNSRYYDPETGRFINADDISYLDKDTINGLNLYAYCGNNPVMNIDPNGNAWWNNLWNNIKNFFTTTFSVFIDVSQNIISKVQDFIFVGYEEGINLQNTIGTDSTPISFYLTNASEWYKIWEYELGVKINIGKFNVSASVGLLGINYSMGVSNSTFDVHIGIDKIGFGSSHSVDKITYYNQFYIRTIPTLALIFATIYAKPLLPVIIKMAFNY